MTNEPAKIACRAWGKINLCLAAGPPERVGPRAGWHPIASWMHCIDLCDDLEVVRLDPSSPSRFEIGAADASFARTPDWPVEKDLAFRAHARLEAELGGRLPVRVRLTKRIPAGAGLGGGSADAAAMLQALDRLFALGLGAERLRAIGGSIGSDVAFFVDDQSPARPAIVIGFGDQIERLKRTRGELTLILPEFGCATPAVYRAFDRLIEGSPHALAEDAVRACASTGLDVSCLFNDLLPAACMVEPGLDAMLDRLGAAGIEPRLSGSGSACFVIGAAPPGERAMRVSLS